MFFLCVCSGGLSEIHGWRWDEILEKTEVGSIYLPYRSFMFSQMVYICNWKYESNWMLYYFSLMSSAFCRGVG